MRFEDIPDYMEDDKTFRVVPAFEREWLGRNHPKKGYIRTLESAKKLPLGQPINHPKGKHPPLIWVLFKTNAFLLLAGGLCRGLQLVLDFTNPVLLQ